MIEIAQKLIHVLERMLDAYERARVLLEAEKKDLIAFSFEELYSKMIEKDELLSVIRKLDLERLRIQEQLALLLNREAESVTLLQIIELLKDTEFEDSDLENAQSLGILLQQLRGDLDREIQDLRSLLKNNQVFIEKSVKNLSEVAQIYSQVLGRNPQKPIKNSKHKTYNKKSKVQEAEKSHSGRILEKRY